ncbi:MAG: hypothetical protein J6X33_03065 [Clostridiales bacterium]|nr:hypothetical protein [Clostridiales bacterium]
MTDKKIIRKPVITAIVLLIQIAVLSSMFIIAANASSSDESYKVDLAYFESDYAVSDDSDSSWSIAEDNVGITDSDHVYALRGPYLEIQRGDYRVDVSYKAEGLQYVKAYSDKDNPSVTAAFERLEPYSDHVSFDIRLNKDIEDLEFVFLYMKNGRFTVNGVTVTSNNAAPVTRAAAVTAMVFILFDICAAFFILRYPKRPDIIAVIAIGLACILPSLPLLVPGLAQGHDLPFHATRIEGIWQELCKGQFPVKMESLWLGGYGYASEIYYGDLFLYFPALLRLAGFSITEAFKFYILFINIITAFVSYFAFAKIFSSKYATAVSCVVYSCAAFRLVDCYVRSTAGEMAALIFLPVVAAGFVSILKKDPAKSLSSMVYDGLLLACGMSGLIITHIITTEMVLAVLVILSVIEFRKMIKRLATVLAAVVCTFLITCSFAVPFIDYTISVSTRISVWMMSDSDRLIQKTGASPLSYFAFTGPFFGGGTGGDSVMSLTPGLLLMAALIAGIVFVILRRGNKRMIICLTASVILLFMASHFFPWDFLEMNLFFGKALVSIQFPWRLLGLAVLFLSVLAGDLIGKIEEDKKPSSKAVLISFIAILAVQSVMAGLTLHSYITEGNFDVQYINTSSLDTSYLGDNEYLPTGVDLDVLDHIAYKTEDGSIDMPVIDYPYYKAFDGNGNTLPVSKGDYGLIRVRVPSGDEDDIDVRFTAPVHWRIADIVSVLSVAGSVVFVFLYRKKKTTADPVAR